MKAKGTSKLLVSGVRTESSGGAVQFAFSHDGTLVYVAGPNLAISRFVWVDRSGEITSLGLPVRSYGEFKLSPDGKSLAVVFGGEKDDIWIYNFERESWSRFTVEGNNQNPVWSPDGTQMAYASLREGSGKLFRKNVDGTGVEQQLAKFSWPDAWTHDGRYLLLRKDQKNWLLTTAEDTLKLQPHARKSDQSWFSAPSPDSHWLAYTSSDLGPWEVFVEDFPSATKRWKISIDGGEEPRWSPDGKELYYRNRDQWFVVPISTETGFLPGKPRLLFEGPYINVYGYSWDVHPDGQRFLVLQAEEHTNPRQIRVVLNWFEELKQDLPTEK